MQYFNSNLVQIYVYLNGNDETLATNTWLMNKHELVTKGVRVKPYYG